MFRSRSWFGGNWGRPRNPHSLEHLKYLYSVMSKNPSITEHNRGLLVESLRCIAEILIWGDQNDSTVFDFFLEKNMLSFFLRIMRQKSGGSSFVCVQLLQTLNILFENIRNETSLYYLLSNNHVNYIIVHKFDFSDEEVMAYYISFLKTLSLKLNGHTIHFFYNEHTNDFPLYTEAIKFFNHPESMVRIAVRTLTLNVYRVEDSSMLTFIRDKTAAPYFSNLVWFIGKHILELDSCVRNESDHLSQNRLADLVAEHLDHLHYLNDILCLDIPDLNAVLTEHLLHKLFVPLYIYSLTPPPSITMFNATQSLAEVLNKSLDLDIGQNKRVSCIVALFLLSQVFLIITHGPLVHSLAWVILNTDHSVFTNGASEVLKSYVNKQGLVKLGFMKPSESLDTTFRTNDDGQLCNTLDEEDEQEENGFPCAASNFSRCSRNQSIDMTSSTSADASSDNLSNAENSQQEPGYNITDEEKQQRLSITNSPVETAPIDDPVGTRPFLETIMAALDCSENDYMALFALCLLYALLNNKGLNSELLDIVLCPARVSGPQRYHGNLMEKLVTIVNLSCQPACRVRLVTLELSLRLLVLLVKETPDSINGLLGALQGARSQSTALLRNFYRTEEIFLDMFEHEYAEISKRPLNVEWLCMDSAVLLPPTGTPLTGIALDKRLPCGEVERARRAIRVYFLVRATIQKLKGQTETQLPLSNASECVQIEAILDLNNSDLIACTVVSRDGSKVRRFLVIDVMQLILVEPDTKRLGFGIAKLVGFLQDIEVTGDKEDPRCLHITIHRTNSSVGTNRIPLLSAKFIFDDHIRSMAAKQKLTKGRIKARAKKMQLIAQLLEIPGQNIPTCSNILSQHGNVRLSLSSRGSRDHRPLFSSAHRVPGFAAALRRESLPGSVSRIQLATRQAHILCSGSSLESSGSYYSNSVIDGENRSRQNSRENSPQRGTPKKDDGNSTRDNSKNRASRSRDGSPKIPRPRSEEIPLEEMRLSQSPVASSSIIIQARPQTPKTVENGNQSTEHVTKELQKKSEETSFIASENGKCKRKGMVETV